MSKLLTLILIVAICGSLEASRQKGGRCSSNRKKRELCQCGPNGPDNCNDVCNTDRDCPGLRKCCQNDCNRVCTLPDTTQREGCPQGEEYQICGPSKPPTCAQPHGTRGDCVSGCFCPPGSFRKDDGRCVKRTECGPLPQIRLGVCSGRHEVYKNKCPGCDRTCVNPTADGCQTNCAEGCYCVEIYVRNGLGHCIPQTSCPTTPLEEYRVALKPTCPYNQEFQSCRRTCEPTCANPSSEGCLRKCQTGCFCISPFLRDYSGNCITATDCPVATTTQPICTEEYTEYKVCSRNCLATCDNPTGAKCNRKCVTGCFCRDNLVWHNGRCVSVSECPPALFVQPPAPRVPVCENEREEYQECGCRRSCEDPSGARCDRSRCVKGCYCRNNYVTDQHGNCIPPDSCPDTPCGEHEVFEECGPDCMDTCNGKVDCVARGSCVSGCYCEPGYVKNTADNTCIPKSRCIAKQVACPDGTEETSSSCSQACQNKCAQGYSGSACPATCRNRCCRRLK